MHHIAKINVKEIVNLFITSSISIYYIKLKSRLSVRPSDRHAGISAVSALIETVLARNES